MEHTKEQEKPASKGRQEKTVYKSKNKKLKFSYNEQREYDTIEDDSGKLEKKIEKLDIDMNKNATNSVKLKELMDEKEETEALLMEKMDRWEYLEDLAKKIQQQ